MTWLWRLLNHLADHMWPADQDDTERRADRAANWFVLVACLATVAVLVLITVLSGADTESARRMHGWTVTGADAVARYQSWNTTGGRY